ncbi:PFU domain containing protein [Pyrenophora tritici-repentis]|nr:PFU domain containing protein [Pyrenophora tritici-repentis]KAI0573397.1 PFU domain-containing protein [Pyrenophora tritici-repentis]KAI0605684.1 PFU domain-containing protein [Pyrenophora tritici-repentis]KAI0617900.1 PFU domain-containing protein [Pyrenophora tritici-repentis]KAI1606640.1 PFU domain containing protein [Pyrenophora tritici-repentis]
MTRFAAFGILPTCRLGPATVHSARSREHSYSHIRVVPHTDTCSTLHEELPVFQSPSLQFSPPHELQNLPVKEVYTESQEARLPTFADMARRYNHKDHHNGLPQLNTNTGLPMGFVKLQPTHKKSSGTWRSMQASDTDENEHDHVFGRLPDPIHLHEKTGTFDGQVLFVGHPNRDVSAHQWSSASFQWVNIGRYAHSCSRIEGSLASDCVQGYAMTYDSLQSFKLAAHNREKHIVENGRPQETSSEELHSTNMETVRAVPSSNAPSSIAPSEFVADDYKQSASSSLHGAVRKDHLDDPFVAYTKPYTPNTQPTARSLYHLPGPTVANPHQMKPVLSPSIHPYMKPPRMTHTTEASGSNATVMSATAVPLSFSDPDGTRTTQEYVPVNGLGRQAPTVQNFRGPFFTDTIPTTSDPTALLSVHISEEEKLLSWFHDGHRPARQQEYARTLVSAAVSSDRYRSSMIAQGSITKQAEERYANTFAFVRVYETLSEYAEELRSDSGRSYFTRNCKL